ncbi:MAG TPA: S8 family serine peptidase [Gaiellaceae bacterium]
MKRAWGTKRLVLLASALASGVLLWGSAAGAAPGGSAVPLARSAGVPAHHIPNSAAGGVAEPRGLGVPASGSYGFLLRLDTEPTGRAYLAGLSRGRTAARTAATSELASVRAAQDRVVSALPSGSQVLYETHAVLAGVAVYTNVANFSALQHIPGVAAVYPIAPKTPSLSYSSLLVHAPQAWSTYSDLGANSTIAIIDTGVDYTHADLGGPGTAAAYQAARASDTSAPTYPDPGKIVGGYDFAGDAYDPQDPKHAKPSPDPNPLDCDGHGTHVAGIAAGYGENPDGSTFRGNYLTLPTDSASYQALFRIGPGMAPQAKLYAYKVFGCQGSTDLIAAAIDRAADPNGDGNTSDHVGVINMSLGSDFTSPQEADSVAANSASKLGISVVVAAGNGGDLYDAGGSPGDAPRVISVANSVDAYSQVDSLHVGAPAGAAGVYGAERSDAYKWASSPDLTGNVVALSDPGNRDGCDALSASDAAAVKGKIAFLEWTDVDASRRCGSAVRSDNVAKAGASGAILADDEDTFAAGITGSKTIPVVIVTRSGGAAIRSALGSGVMISGTSAGDFKQLLPLDDDELNSSSSRGIGAAGDVKPDVTGVGTSVFSSAMGTGNQGISFSGTSMSSPEVAGLAALVRTKHPDWNPEEVKADIMNTADQDLWTNTGHTGVRYAPNRVGAGRIDAKAALDNLVLAYVTSDPGAVSASFGPVAVSARTTLTKTVAVVNKGAGAVTYSVAYDPLTQVPGATYSVSPSSVTVGAGGTASITLTLAIDPSKLTKPIDLTVPRTQAGFPRDYTADASGRLLLTGSGQPTLRVPVYAAPRPVARMTQPSALELPGGKVQTASLRLKGTQLSQGSGGTAIRSLVAGFELQARSGTLHLCRSRAATGCIHANDEKAADLKYVGTTSNAPELTAIKKNPLRKRGLEYFAITTQGPWRTPALSDEYDIYIDSTGNKKPDAILFNTRLPDSDIFVAALVKPRTGKVLDIEPIDDRLGNVDAAAFDSDTLVMPVAISALPGVSKRHTRITYGVASYSSFVPKPVDRVGLTRKLRPDGTLHTDVLRPGIAVYGHYGGRGSALLYRDASGTRLHVRRDASAYEADHGKGALIVHFQDAVGHKAQVVKVESRKRRSG